MTIDHVVVRFTNWGTKHQYRNI